MQKNSPEDGGLRWAPRLRHSTVLRLAAVAAILLACLIRIVSLKYQSADYLEFLLPWTNHIKTYGFSAFADEFANYNLPYLYLLFVVAKLPVATLLGIKAISLVFDFVLAFGVYLVVKNLINQRAKAFIAGIVTLFLPTVFINSAVWAQCDSIYVSLLVFSFLFVLKKQPLYAWLFWAVAFTFKLQAIFFPAHTPLSMVVGPIGEMVDPSHYSTGFFLAFLPALAAGRSFGSILSIYISQGGQFPALSYNAPTIYQLVDVTSVNTAVLGKAGVIFASAVVLGILVFTSIRHKKQTRLSAAWLVGLASLFLLVIPFLLPHMHERYFFAGEIFCLLYAFTHRGFMALSFVAGTQLISFVTYAPFLFMTSGPALPFAFLSLGMFSIILGLSYRLFRTTEET